MNHFHRVIFNPSLGLRQVVSEIASSGRGAGSQVSTSSAPQGGTGNSSATRATTNHRFKASAGVAFLLALGMASAAQGQAFGGSGGMGGESKAVSGGAGGTSAVPNAPAASDQGSSGGGGGGGGTSLSTGTGGRGAAGGATAGGLTGGAGGMGGMVGSTTAINNAGTLTGGAGANGGLGGQDMFNGSGSGGGGGGGFGLVLIGSGPVNNSGHITGGAGGVGGDGAGFSEAPDFGRYGGGAGGGGAGGGGVLLTGSGFFTNANAATIAGGNGGNGGAAVAEGGGGSGGDGGIGVALTGGGALANSGSIIAGAGGSPGSPEQANFNDRVPSRGGTAVLVTAGGTVQNMGLLEGGRGGVSATGLPLPPGAGGAGVVATGNTSVTNAGSITGGLGGDGATRANAIDFSGGNNTLTLQAGYAFNGNVVSTSGAALGGDTLALGGDTSAAFDVGSLSASYAGTQYLGFSNFVKNGASTWVLTGNDSAARNWSLSGGKLSVANDASLGAASGALTFNGGTLQVTGTTFTSTARTINWGASSGGFDIVDGNATFGIAQALTGTGALVKQGAGTLALSGANTYTDGTTVTAGTLELATTGAAGSGSILVENAYNQNATLQVNVGVNINNEVAANNGGTLNNSGTILRTASGSFGVVSYGGATINNSATGSIKGYGIAVAMLGGGTITNSGGLIESIGSGAFSAVAIQGGAGTVINEAGGTIKGATDGVFLFNGGSVVNDVNSAINAAGEANFSVFIDGGTLVNKGSLFGRVTLDPFLRGTAVNTATLFTGSTLQGNLEIGTNSASSLILDGLGQQRLSDAVTGTMQFAGTLVQQGGGTWIVDKDLTPASTTIAAGSTLQLGNGGTVGSVTGAITANGTLAINRSDTLTFNNVISGTGGLSQTGPGTTILNAANTYRGGTQVNAGILSVDADNKLGDASGALTFGGGTLKNTAAITTGRTFYANASNSTFQTDADLTITTAVQGNGNLVKTGAATLVLEGNSTYAGNTTISAGTLQVGNGGASGRLSFGPVTNNATLAFNRSDDDFIDSNPISGAGNVVQKGTGTLILAGNNTYRGGTSLNAGVTSVFSDSNLGHAAGALTFNGGALQNTAAFTTARAITLNAGGTIQTNASLEATGVIDGAGSLTKTGAGNLILSGANTYTGATTVNAGTLSVNGSITSDTTVNSGGALGGSGNVRNVTIASGGTLAPGNSIGTLTVNGNLTFAPGSIYRVETDAAGNADRVNVVGGTLNINGGTVDVQAGAGNYARNTSYTILTSAGATTGAFTGVTSNLAFLTPSLSYLPNGVTLNLLAEDAPAYNTVAQTTNQASVANYLNSFANTPGSAAAAALIQQIDNLSADQARTAFDSMSGSQHVAASQITGALGRNFSAALSARSGSGSTGLIGSSTSTAGLKAPQYAALSPVLLNRPGDVVSDSPLRVAAADPSGDSQDRPALQSVGGLWGQATGTGGRTGSDGNGAASRYRANGFVFGYDQALSPEWLGGIALAYNKAQWDASTNGIAAANGRISTPQAGLYARYTDGSWQVRLDGTYSDHRFSTDRTVTIGNASSIARSSHGGTEWAFAAQAEYSLPAGDWDVRPLAGLRHARLSEDGFTETGAGAASLAVDARRSQNTVASLGVKLAKPLGDQGGKLQLSAIASHLMGDNDSPLSSRLAGQAASFTAAGTPIKRTALTLGGTLTGQLSRGLSAYADAAYEYRGSGQNAFMFTAGLRLNW